MEVIFGLGGMAIGAVLWFGFLALIVVRTFKQLFGTKGSTGHGRRKADRFADVAGRDGLEIEKTTFGKLGVANLDSQVGVIASFGTKQQGTMSLDDVILVPTFGLRMISLCLSAACGFFVFSDVGGGQFVQSVALQVGLVLMIAYGLLFTQFYELRYNRDRLIGKGRFLNRREHNWCDLVRLQDNGHYMFILTFEDGRKLEVPKHLKGMPDFLTTAQEKIQQNRSVTPNPARSPILGR